jgi:hypothetical protein
VPTIFPANTGGQAFAGILGLVQSRSMSPARCRRWIGLRTRSFAKRQCACVWYY